MALSKLRTVTVRYADHRQYREQHTLKHLVKNAIQE